MYLYTYITTLLLVSPKLRLTDLTNGRESSYQRCIKEVALRNRKHKHVSIDTNNTA